ncbi:MULTISPECIES: type II toxin-antitoxin system Phd/YefM family antitoxin [Streptococcaceae]|jgi:prevent-host-death family protein|uniref:Antitoxin n=2 Tax=Streptococcaceae TaxID=1300 RepID=A0A552YYN7_9LACT|nr:MULTISPECIES: type II toxin-antitoxin system Phd/YefM family antitoxin [Lactococcus]MCQ5069014.1 type II toxin-antitoxin system Phd/YefM family antitoxin [Faecalibacillus intestinalis]MDN5611569.1 type II toxin-antitoxin system Phd/YefM family antitoxin [Staphylococcus equorum]MSU87947.1 type II toxin-antitoxin system Phd/YefM family antitoxin [Streptococcus dysgalactiae subsp. dysgalactiae]MCH5425997.1 type II toxin-antitoxin system Phd/YefM family antitoxin [Lactococcus lactis]MCH5428528.
MKKENTFINGEIVSSAEIRKSWKSIVDTVNHTKKPTYVLSNNIPTVVIIDYDEYTKIQEKLKLK